MSTQIDDETTQATARFPGLKIEIARRTSPTGDAEQISINLQAVPSFEAFGQFLHSANPFAFWVQTAQMMWLPWLGTVGHMTLPRAAASAPPKLAAEHSGSSAQKRLHGKR